MKILCAISLLLIAVVCAAQNSFTVPDNVGSPGFSMTEAIGRENQAWEKLNEVVRHPCGALLPRYASCLVLHEDYWETLAMLDEWFKVPQTDAQDFDIDWDGQYLIGYRPGRNRGIFEANLQFDPRLPWDADTIHVFDSIYFKAVREDGTEMPAVLVSEPQATLPLPAGKYFVTVFTKDPDLVEGYLHFVKADTVLVGKSAALSGGTTRQALIRVKKNPDLAPPNLFIAESGRGWTMYQNDDYYYAYVVENTVVTIYLGQHEFRIKPAAGEIWDLDVTMFQLSWDPGDMFSDPAIPEVPQPPAGPVRIQAEDYTEWHNLRLSAPSVLAPPEYGIGGTANGSWIKYAAVNLTGKKTITVRQSSINEGRIMEIRTGSVDGVLIASYAGKNTGSWSTFEEITIPIVETQGAHDLYFIFRSSAVLDMDWFELR